MYGNRYRGFESHSLRQPRSAVLPPGTWREAVTLVSDVCEACGRPATSVPRNAKSTANGALPPARAGRPARGRARERVQLCFRNSVVKKAEAVAMPGGNRRLRRCFRSLRAYWVSAELTKPITYLEWPAPCPAVSSRTLAGARLRELLQLPIFGVWGRIVSPAFSASSRMMAA